MVQSTTVRVKNVISVKFPNKCIMSGYGDPDDKASIVAHGGNPIVTFLVPILHLFWMEKGRVSHNEKV